MYKRAAFPSKRVLIPHYKRRKISKTLESCMKNHWWVQKTEKFANFLLKKSVAPRPLIISYRK
jgi:hypothetical protein